MPLRVIEVQLSGVVEHRRWVVQRRNDFDGLTVPTWAQVVRRHYESWDQHRDGPRLAIANRIFGDALDCRASTGRGQNSFVWVRAGWHIAFR